MLTVEQLLECALQCQQIRSYDFYEFGHTEILLTKTNRLNCEKQCHPITSYYLRISWDD